MAIAGTVVITGASRGIGEACALHLDKLGFQVFAGVRTAKDGNVLREKASGRITPLLIDVTDTVSIAAAADTVAATVKESGLNGLVNNAGIAIAGPLEYLPLTKLREQLEVNVIGQIAVTQMFLPLLRKGKGRIVNIGSREGKMAMPFLGPYCASKFALEALTDSLRMELRAWGIMVSLVEPGITATHLLEKSIAAAEECIANLPRQAHELYDPSFTAGRAAASSMVKITIPTDAVAKAVTQALTAKKPKTRYIVGRDAKLISMFAKLVPDRVRDWLIVRQMRLPRSTRCSS